MTFLIRILLPNGIITEETIGTYEVLELSLVQPPSIFSEEQFGFATTLTTSIVLPVYIDSSETFYDEEWRYASVLSEECFGVPTITAKAANLIQSIPSQEIFGTPLLRVDEKFIAVDSIQISEVFGSTRVINVHIEPDGINTNEIFGTPWVINSKSSATLTFLAKGRKYLYVVYKFTNS